MFFRQSTVHWLLLGQCVLIVQTSIAQKAGRQSPVLEVQRCEHFTVTGRGDAEAWELAEWNPMSRRPGGHHEYTARFKMLYSTKGVYVLFDASDTLLSASMQSDFLDLWKEDVFECFFWTDEQYPVYFEYEMSPLGFELPILIPNFGGDFLGWRPWRYQGAKATEKQVAVFDGPQLSGAAITGWRAEVYFPYELFEPLQNVPPQTGDRWRANFYRVDYDRQETTQWDWARVGDSFHDFRKFGHLIFK